MDAWIPEALATKQQSWLIDGMIPSDGVVIISGQQKRARKTYFAMSLGLGVATGTHPILSVKGQGPVLGIFEEGRDAPTAERFTKLYEAHGLDTVPNFHIAWRPRIKLDDKDHRKALLEAIDTIKPVFVILDPFFRMISGDENRQEDVNKVIDTVFDIRDKGCTVALLAHLDKSRGESHASDIDQQIRGSGVLANSYDVHLALRKYKAKHKHIQLTVRDREGPERVYHQTWNKDATYKLVELEADE